MEKQRFQIEGMTCSGCEWTLEKAVSRLEGVCKQSADYRSGLLEVSYSAPCTEAAIIQAVEAAGYGVAEQPRRQPDGLYLLVLLLGLYLIARHLGLTRVFQSFPTVSGAGLGYAALFVIGLLTSVHCIAMCGGLNLAQSLGDEAPHPLRGSILYNLGRLTSYTVIGGLLGFLGEQVAVTLRVLKRKWRQRMLALGAALLVLLVLMGLYTLQNNLALAGVTLPGGGSSEGPVLSTVENGVQYVRTTLRPGGYDDIQVVAGIPVVWTISADESALNGCNNELVIPAFDQQVKLAEGTTTIKFTPQELGSFSYSCWMGMLRNTITVVPA